MYISLYDSPAIDMLDYGDNSGCWQLANESDLDYEYERCAYIYQQAELFDTSVY